MREEPTEQIKKRTKVILALFGCALAYLCGMLVRYQILTVDAQGLFIKPAFSQRQEGVPITLGRGLILDRNGVVLHSPYWSTAVALFPSNVTDQEQFVSKAAALTGVPVSKIRAIFDTAGQPVKLVRNISSEMAQTIMQAEIPGLSIVPEEMRYGPGSLARHVVGHVRPNAYVNLKDNVGESGIEKWFQAQLAVGQPAWAGTLVTGEGNEIPGAGVRIGFPRDCPFDLVTSLDVRIQRSVEKVLDERIVEKGAVVVLDARTGEILAMASRPQYDQNEPELALESDDGPFVNRAISDFTPGSIWKTVIMALALEKGYVTGEELFECKGEVNVGSATILCNQSSGGHGWITAKEALAKSCNSAMIEIGLRIPANELIEWASHCGFGKQTMIPLPNESKGLLPNPEKMFVGDVANCVLGQGYLTVTPIQVAAFYRAIINDGMYSSPVLLKGVQAQSTRLFSASTCKTLQDALLMATQDGTATQAWVTGLGSAGKTGTAEVEGNPPQNHAWFAGWCPVVAPKYVICVFSERFGDGPGFAAPIFGDIAKQLLMCD